MKFVFSFSLFYLHCSTEICEQQVFLILQTKSIAITAMYRQLTLSLSIAWLKKYIISSLWYFNLVFNYFSSKTGSLLVILSIILLPLSKFCFQQFIFFDVYLNSRDMYLICLTLLTFPFIFGSLMVWTFYQLCIQLNYYASVVLFSSKSNLPYINISWTSASSFVIFLEEWIFLFPALSLSNFKNCQTLLIEILQ